MYSHQFRHSFRSLICYFVQEHNFSTKISIVFFHAQLRFLPSCADIEQRISLDFLQDFFFFLIFILLSLYYCVYILNRQRYIQQNIMYLYRMQQKQKKIFQSSLVISKIWDLDGSSLILLYSYLSFTKTVSIPYFSSTPNQDVVISKRRISDIYD